MKVIATRVMRDRPEDTATAYGSASECAHVIAVKMFKMFSDVNRLAGVLANVESLVENKYVEGDVTLTFVTVRESIKLVCSRL